MLCLPVGKNEALEAKLVLEEVVLDVRVLARVGVVDLFSNQQSTAESLPVLTTYLVVRAHDTGCSSTDSISKGPQVQLVHCNVINVGAERCLQVARWRSLTEVLLFISDVVLCASHDASCLDTLNGLGNCNTRQ